MNNRHKVILVEDNIADAELTKIAFSEFSSPYEIVHLQNGLELFDYMEQADLEDILFILLDLNMPKMNGIEVLRKFHVDPIFRRIPTIVFSTSLHENDIETCYELGANAYVNKPLSMDEFEKTIRTIITFWTKVNVRPIFVS